MKLLNCISSAFSDITYKKTYAFRMIVGIAFITAVIQSSFLILRVIQNDYDKTMYDMLEENAIVYNTTVSEEKTIYQSDIEMLNALSEIENTAPSVCSIPLNTMGYINDTDHKFIKLSRTTLVCDDTKYTGKATSMYIPGENYSKTPVFSADLYLSEYGAIDKNTQKQFGYYYPDDKLFLYGGPAQQAGEIMINSYILSHYGIDNPDSIIGKTVTFLIDDIEYIKNLKVAGVINENYFNMKSTALKNDIIIYDTIENIEKYCIGGEDVQLYVPINNLLNNVEVYKSVQQFNSAKIICSESVLAGLSYTEKLSEVSRKILGIICVFIVFSMILSIFSIIRTNIVSSRKYYGMLSAIGMNRRSLFISFFSEQILLVLIALLFSFPIYEILVIVINKIIALMISDEITITVSQLFHIYSVSSFMSFMIIVLISCFAFWISVPKNIVDSLK